METRVVGGEAAVLRSNGKFGAVEAEPSGEVGVGSDGEGYLRGVVHYDRAVGLGVLTDVLAGFDVLEVVEFIAFIVGGTALEGMPYELGGFVSRLVEAFEPEFHFVVSLVRPAEVRIAAVDNRTVVDGTVVVVRTVTSPRICSLGPVGAGTHGAEDVITFGQTLTAILEGFKGGLETFCDGIDFCVREAEFAIDDEDGLLPKVHKGLVKVGIIFAGTGTELVFAQVDFHITVGDFEDDGL